MINIVIITNYFGSSGVKGTSLALLVSLNHEHWIGLTLKNNQPTDLDWLEVASKCRFSTFPE